VVSALTWYYAAGKGMAGASRMREAEELSRVIGDVYDASLDPALWPNAIESICDYVGAASRQPAFARLDQQGATDALFWWAASQRPSFLQELPGESTANKSDLSRVSFSST